MPPEIVDVHKLAEKLQISVSTLQKTWKSLPHFFVGVGYDLRGARFELNDVIEFLKERDYFADAGSENQAMDRPGKTYKSSSKSKTRFSYKKQGRRLGIEDKERLAKSKDDPHNLLSGIDGVS